MENKKPVAKKFITDKDDALIKYVTVKELVKGIRNRSSEDARRVYLEGTLAVRNYERYEVVCAVCDGIIETSYFTHDKDGKRTGFKQDSCKKYVLYINALLSTFTNIIVDPDDAMGDYNLLNRYGLVDIIISYIPESAVVMFDSVLNMKSNDVKANYYEPHAFITEQLVKYAPVLHKFLDGMLGVTAEVVENLDVNEIRKIMKQ